MGYLRVRGECGVYGNGLGDGVDRDVGVSICRCGVTMKG